MAPFLTGLQERQNGHSLRGPEGESAAPGSGLVLCLKTRVPARPPGGPGRRGAPGAAVWGPAARGRAARRESGLCVGAPGLAPGGGCGGRCGEGREESSIPLQWDSGSSRHLGDRHRSQPFRRVLGAVCLSLPASPAFDDPIEKPLQGPQRARVPPAPAPRPGGTGTDTPRAQTDAGGNSPNKA